MPLARTMLARGAAGHRPRSGFGGPRPDGRLGRVLRWLRWPVVVVWLVAVVALDPLASSLPDVTSNSASAYLPSSADSTKVVDLEQAAGRGRGMPDVDALIVVFGRGGGLTAADEAAVASAHAAVARLAGTLRLSAPGGPVRSADGKASYFAAAVTTPASSELAGDTAAVQSVRRAASAAASRVHDGLQAAVTGQAAIVADSGVTSKAQTDLRLTALAIIVVILLLVYRRPFLWLFPLFGAIGAIVVAEAGAHGLGNAGLTVSSLSASILVVLVLGAASDYALLLVHRYREELGRHAAAEDAMAAALRRTFPTLIASAGTVTCAMLCLLAARSASLHGLGPVGAAAIVSALLAQTTFLPALLLVFGRAAFWPRAPRHGTAGRDESRIWSGIGTRVARRPVPVALAAVVLLGAACVSLAALHTDNSPASSVKGHPGSVTGQQMLAAHYPAGAFSPLDLLTPPAEAAGAAAAARATPGVASVAPSTPAGSHARYTITLSVDPYRPRGGTVIAGLRDRLARDAPGSLVGGGPAIQYDTTQAARHDALVLIPLVLLVILVIIALLLRAIAAAVVLVATTALSFAASFGLANLLFRHGLGYPGIESQIPLYIFIFLVALGVDYNIFLSARIREESRQAGLLQGTLRGLGVTGGVITAAGIVLAGTFADLTRLPNASVAEVGITVAIGVLLDTLLVRTVLVPAAFLSIGQRVWWPARPPTGLPDMHVSAAQDNQQTDGAIHG
jgi:putative drug exporter of the RND superfamily